MGLAAPYPSFPLPARNTTIVSRDARWSAILVLAALAGYLVWVKLALYVHFTPGSYRRYWPVRWWLAFHILGGVLALAIGPLQLTAALRRRSLRLHRILGRIYLGSIAVGSVGAMYMALFHARGGFAVALTILDVVWAGAAAMALLAIRYRQIDAHREWMSRSYVLTYAFVVHRVLLRSALLHKLGPEEAAADLWLCWVAPLIVTEFARHWRRLTASL